MCEKKELKISAISTLLWYVFTHGFWMTNKITYFDDAFAQFTLGEHIGMGRWFYAILYLLYRFIFGGSNYSLSLFNLIMMLAIIVCVWMIVRLFDITSGLDIILISGIMVTSPAMIGLNAYNFLVHFYAVSILLAVAGACLICRSTWKYGWIMGSALLCLSLAIYQAYVALSICILLL